MPALKRIKISVGRRGGRDRGRPSQKSHAKPTAEVREDDISMLELETLYMIGAPAS